MQCCAAVLLGIAVVLLMVLLDGRLCAVAEALQAHVATCVLGPCEGPRRALTHVLLGGDASGIWERLLEAVLALGT